VVSGETYDRLEFWVPIVVAALCAYGGSRAWAALERRYAAPPPEAERGDAPAAPDAATQSPADERPPPWAAGGAPRG
jgi:hypothetical protein